MVSIAREHIQEVTVINLIDSNLVDSGEGLIVCVEVSVPVEVSEEAQRVLGGLHRENKELRNVPAERFDWPVNWPAGGSRKATGKLRTLLGLAPRGPHPHAFDFSDRP